VPVRCARREDLLRIHAFYAERGYGGGVRPSDTLLVAEEDAQLIGVVRLAPEGDVVVLRGMQVHPDHQRRGIRSRLLARVAGEVQGQPCYCIPYAHLVAFYSAIGFEVIAPSDAPDFLRERLERYRARADGREYLLMHRRPLDPASGTGPPPATG
jgi:N-acetylglutamate synthase-like GNAT family acetyltransferase